MATIHVDGVAYQVREGANLLEACLSAGLDLPYFCWHPSLGSVGACRQCAVMQYRDADDTRGKLAMACMTPVADGSRLSIGANEAVEFRAAVIEWLMLNHPHDCPVCEEGGECHLQDMTVMTGHVWRRYRGPKRTFRNQYLGPFLTHEMNRCITCYRCVRFYRDYAGGRDLDAFGSRDRMYFGRAEDGVLESEFSGNLVEVCPTGVFTDKPFSASYTRKWDLMSAPSVCPGCAIGCNTLPGERYGRLKRVHNRYHGEINGYFLCDRGRYGADFVNADTRLRHPGVRTEDGSFDVIEADDAVERFAHAIRRGVVVGIGSPRASLESNFALASLVGAPSFSIGVADHEAPLLDRLLEIHRTTAARVPTLEEVEAADAVLVLGEDVSNTAPRLALALRQSVRNLSFEMARQANFPTWQDAGVRGHAQHARSPLLSATALPTRLDDIASSIVHATPDDLARIGFAVVHALDAAAPAPADLSEAESAFAAAAADALAGAERPLIVSGTGVASEAVLDAAAAIAGALAAAGRAPSLLLAAGECNAVGAALLGGELTLSAALETCERGEAQTLVVLENDLFRRVDAERLERILARTSVIALDVVETPTLERAELVLPAASMAESDGTYVNYETRAQRFYRVFVPAGDVEPAWRWMTRAAAAAGRNDLRFEHVDDLIDACAASRAALADIAAAGPGADDRPAPGIRVAREPHRYSGRTAMDADRSVHEPKAPVDEESPLSFSMEGLHPRDPGALLTYAWAPAWNSNQSIFKFQDEVAGSLRGGDPGVRLIAGNGGAERGGAAGAIPAPYAAGEDFLAVPLAEVFGSDELSARARAIEARTPAPYLVLAPRDAARLGLATGDGVRIGRGAHAASVGVRIAGEMPAGACGFVTGLTGGLYLRPGDRLALAADPDYRPPATTLIARG